MSTDNDRAGDDQAYGDEGEEQDEDLYVNNHDLIGV